MVTIGVVPETSIWWNYTWGRVSSYEDQISKISYGINHIKFSQKIWRSILYYPLHLLKLYEKIVLKYNFFGNEWVSIDPY